MRRISLSLVSQRPVCSTIDAMIPSQSASCSSWPPPSNRTRVAPATASDRATPCSIGKIGSAVPWITRSGTPISRNRPCHASPPLSMKWFVALAKFSARSTSRSISLVAHASSNGCAEPASMREFATMNSNHLLPVRPIDLAKLRCVLHVGGAGPGQPGRVFAEGR